MSQQTLYQQLQVDRNAAPPVIEAAYNHLYEQAGEDERMTLANAFAVLSDPQKRKAYDEALDADAAERTASSTSRAVNGNERAAGSTAAAASITVVDSERAVRNGADVASADLVGEAVPSRLDPADMAGGDSNTPATVPADEETLYCANHPDRETLLRCNRCGKPMCMQCAQLTDVGYRCRECIRGVQDSYFNAKGFDNVIAFFVALGVTALATPLATLLIGMFGFFGFILAFLLGSGAGASLAQIVRSSVGKRRGRNLRIFSLLGIVVGFLVGSVAALVLNIGFPILNLPVLLFVFLAGATAFGMLR